MMVLDSLTFVEPFKVALLRYRNAGGSFHRESRSPGDDVSDLPQAAQDAIVAEWTPEVIAAYVADTTPIPPTPEEQAETARTAAFVGDISRAEFITHLRTDSLAQIEAFVRNQINVDGVTDLATAKQCLKRMETGFVTLMKTLALIAR